MVATRVPVVRREISGLRVRLGVRGKLIVQVRNRMERVPPYGMPSSAGHSHWRDATANEPGELAFVILQLCERTR